MVLKIHISRKHDDIPQLDRKSDHESNTNYWWDERYEDLPMSFQFYKDVFMDINNIEISEHEKVDEYEKSPIKERSIW